jgi:peptidyl-prolyl cis-trans isomerase C
MMTIYKVLKKSSSFYAIVACGFVLSPWNWPVFGVAQERREKVLAMVGEEAITEADLDHVLRSLRVKGQFPVALKTHTEEGRKEILDKMVETLLLCRGAASDGFLETETMKRKLRWQGSQLVAEAYAKDKLFSEYPTTEEMIGFYKGHQDLFKRPPEVKVRHIVVKEQNQAEKLLEELNEGASFEGLAEKHNVDASRNREGLIGWIRPGMMVQPFDEAAFSLHKGETSEIVQTRFGFHILKIADRKEGSVRPFEEVKKDVVKAMREEQLESFKKELSKTWKVQVYE